MRKLILFLVIISLLVIPFRAKVYAEETTSTTLPEGTTTLETTTTTTEEPTTTTTTEESATTTEEINLPRLGRPGILPGNPFYFLKSWWRGLKLGFIFNPVKKAEEETNITEDTLNETAQVVLHSKRADALKKALENYNNHIEALKKRLENLKATSNNPNIDNLLDRLTKLQMRHQMIFDRLIKHSPQLGRLRQQIEEKINHDIPAWQLRWEKKNKFVPRLEKQIKESQPLAPQHQGGIRHLNLLEGAKNRLENIDTKKLTPREKTKLQDWKEKIEEKIQEKRANLEKQGISSSTIDKITQEEYPFRARRHFKRLPRHKPHFNRPPKGNPPY